MVVCQHVLDVHAGSSVVPLPGLAKSNVPISQRTSSKRILLFTNTDDPHAACPDLKRQVETKARDLAEIGITIDLLHMAKPGQRFDFKAFYANIVTFVDVRVFFFHLPRGQQWFELTTPLGPARASV